MCWEKNHKNDIVCVFFLIFLIKELFSFLCQINHLDKHLECNHGHLFFLKKDLNSQVLRPSLQIKILAHEIKECFCLHHKKCYYEESLSNTFTTQKMKFSISHIYWRNPWWKTSFFVQYFSIMFIQKSR